MSFFNTFRTKMMTLGKKDSHDNKAVTFSPPKGQSQANGEEEMTCSEDTGKNLVVASMESRFTDEMIDYAIEMAQRMNFGIIAVNAANLTHDVTEFFSTTHEELFRDFKETATLHVEPFRTKATELGLRFAHAIKYSDVDQAIADITKECGQIEFIITENKEPVVTRDTVANDNRIAQKLFVYAVD